MKRESVNVYVSFGTCMRYLQDARETYRIKGKNYVVGNLVRFLERIEKLDLQVTLHTTAFRELQKLRKALEKVKDGTANLSAEHVDKLVVLMEDIRKTLTAELAGYDTFVVTPKIMDTQKLLDSVDSLLAPGVFKVLPEISQYDLVEAGKCIAFERPTAGAFHLLRGTEAVLRMFYCRFVTRKRVSPLMWGNMTSDLRDRPRTKQHTTLYNNLDNIRHSYRNPTQHPEMIYNIHEVQDLWPLCTEVINRMVRILQAT